MLNKHRVASSSRRVGSSPQRPAVQPERTGPLEGRVRAKDISAELLARIQAGARAAAPNAAAMRELFQTPSPIVQGSLGYDAPLRAYGEFWSDANCKARIDRILAAQKTPPVETCPYCVKGITDDDAECSFCMGAGKLT
jgi:hypothetical protein